MTADLPDVSVHFGRFRVTEITVTESGLRQFDPAPMVQAADLLADAHVGAVVWNGTSGGWMGFDEDERLCTCITEATGLPSTTSVLALNQALRALDADRVSFVTPYVDDVQERVLGTYTAAGWTCGAEQHLGIDVNEQFSRVPLVTIEQMVREVARDEPDVIVTFCTNLRAASLVADFEAELGIPVVDTTALAVWAGLGLTGHDPAAVQGWGQLFWLPYPSS